jgi:Xaa-Pro aminopeptidase
MTEPYRGDAALTSLLRADGVVMEIEAVRDLIKGAVSALAGRKTETWIELIAPDAAAELRAQLVALKEETAKDADPGFTVGPAPNERLAALRAELTKRGLDGFLIPRGDAYQSEYVPARADRLRWLTGFTGSAGLAIVLRDKAAIFIDGRYTIQVRKQVDMAAYEPHDMGSSTPANWIAANLRKGAKLGFDPWLHTERQIEAYERGAARTGATLVPVDDNPLDIVWRQQPAMPVGAVLPHDDRFAGVSASAKRTAIAETLAKNGIDAAVVTAPDSIAWLLNIRGGDVPRTPLPMSWAILRKDSGVELFIDPRKLTRAAKQHLGNQVSVKAPESFLPSLEALGRAGATVQVDPGAGSALERELGVAWVVFDRLKQSGATVIRDMDPCALPKAMKNQVEIAGARSAHRRDAAAITRFLAWMEKMAPSGTLTEIDAANQLDAFRREVRLFVEPSFNTISAAGPNSALPHYRPNKTSNRRIEPRDIYLCDSGGQFHDGTTDITRTIAVGTPTQRQKEIFTHVLRSHIAVASATFPEGTRGGHLDGLARRPLWDVGLDFGHGTGHGVGSYLNVHEGPHTISTAPTSAPFRPGMIVSNEPGCYLEGDFGVRIENLIVAMPLESAGSRPFLSFETLTCAPIDLNLVEPSLLTADEIVWLDGYHRWVKEIVEPQVEGETRDWLVTATRPLAV